jgi:hypothetical protein
MKSHCQPFVAAAALTLTLLMGGCAQGNLSAGGPGTPGWTGRTVVVGNNSTIAGDATATENQQKWPLGRSR